MVSVFDDTTSIIILAVAVIFVLLVLFKKPVQDYMARREGKNVKIDNPYDKDQIPDAPKVQWPAKFTSPSHEKEDTSSMKEILIRLDNDLKQSRDNVKRVLGDVVDIQTDIYNKMQSYFEISKDLDQKESILRNNLTALNAAKPTSEEYPIEGIQHCPNCSQELVFEKGNFLCNYCGVVKQ